MAPSATATATETVSNAVRKLNLVGSPGPEDEKKTFNWHKEFPQDENKFWSQSEAKKAGKPYPYERFLPTFDGHLKLPPLTEFEHVDPGHEAVNDANPLSFLEGAVVEDVTPRFGSEISGVQLSKLTAHERAQLALFVARRGVVAFRDQDFHEQSPEWQLWDWGSSFGRIHTHPTSGAPEGYPEFHLVYKDDHKTFNYQLDTRLTSSAWHSDVTYEKQPPGLTALFLYDSPPSGGDTGYADQRKFLEGLTAVHSGVAQAEFSRKGNRGGIVKREPVENVHPIVRRHPVTGEKALFVNRQFTRSIPGLKIEESDALLELLYNHIEKGADFQVRMRWKPRTVTLWDNRITAHTATVDFDGSGARRHGARITPQAEKPTL